MADLIRDAPIGQLLRYITKNRILQYPEERPDFQIPAAYLHPDSQAQRTTSTTRASSLNSISKTHLSEDEKAGVEPAEDDPSVDAPHVLGTDLPALTTIPTGKSYDLEHGLDPAARQDSLRSIRSQIEHDGARRTLERTHSQKELQDAFAAAQMQRDPSRQIVPQRTGDGNILVDWYTEGDLENPQNWSQGKKARASIIIYLYTMAVYMGSSIITASSEGIMQEFNVGIEAVSLTLALYTLAYGIGPLIFSPISELPSVGRNPPYVITFGIFVILCVPAALAPNFAGLLVLRFLQGFFGSPCLATGGASLGDIYSFVKLPYVMCLWALAATCGPAMGPLISGFSVAAENWRWSLWEMLWLAGPIFLAMLFLLPETSAATILLRRAQRLRVLTGNENLRAQSEIAQANIKPKDLVFDALIRPIQLMIMDPAIGFTALYTALCYGIYYSFFEAFPLVYIDMYGFNLGQMGLTFLSITVGVVLAIIIYYAWMYWVVEPDIARNGFGAPEKRLVPALYASFLCPIGLFLFGWTSNPDIHWIVSIIGILIFTVGIFIIMQCIFVYLPFVYPQYAASLFAGNDFARSSLAFAAVLFSRPMYINLGIGRGSSLLGGLTAGCIIGVFVLYVYGDRLRARSRFSAK